MSETRARLAKAPKDGVIVRRAPSDTSGVAGKLYQGAFLRYSPEINNGFVSVKTANIAGWLPLKGLKLEDV